LLTFHSIQQLEETQNSQLHKSQAFDSLVDILGLLRIRWLAVDGSSSNHLDLQVRRDGIQNHWQALSIPSKDEIVYCGCFFRLVSSESKEYRPANGVRDRKYGYYITYTESTDQPPGGLYRDRRE
jgi:hypothetical protein